LREAPLLRLEVESTDDNGLRKSSQIMVDKPQTMARERAGKSIGRLD